MKQIRNITVKSDISNHCNAATDRRCGFQAPINAEDRFLGVAQLVERVVWDHQAVRAGLTTQTSMRLSETPSSPVLELMMLVGPSIKNRLYAPMDK